jgi:fused signal recognition particle receptor
MLKWFKKKTEGSPPDGEPRAEEVPLGDTAAIQSVDAPLLKPAAEKVPLPESEAGQPPTESRPERKGLFQRLREGLSKTRTVLAERLDRLVLGKREITEEVLDELEEILFTSDIGVATTEHLLNTVRRKVARKELKDVDLLKAAIREEITQYLKVPATEVSVPGPAEPLVIMVVGINGVGKTTTIGKTAHRFRREGKSVILVAADTFRAAAVEQLVVWGERTGAEVIKQGTGADPAAVVYDGLSAALSRKSDVVIIDTAGRLHTKANLMEELQKIHRTASKRIPGAPHQVWLVLDATTGQNALSQAQLFNKAMGLTGLVVTKLDGTAKGGIIIGICRELKVPVLYIGIGEKVDDLRPFDPEEFVSAILE